MIPSNRTVIVQNRPSDDDGITRAYAFSPDFCKKETWWVDAVQAAQMSFDGDGTTTVFQLDGASGVIASDERILDLNNGKITFENFLFSAAPGDYLVKVQLATVAKVERRVYQVSGGDYTVDYITGNVTFLTPPPTGTGNILVDYWYVPAGALAVFIAKPPAGKKWIIDYAESQFSKDVQVNDTIMQNQLTGDPLTSILPLGPVEYRTLGSFMDIAVGAYPEIPALSTTGGRGLQQPTQVFRWSYNSSFSLHASRSDCLKIWLENGVEFGGERATITFYAAESIE